MEDDQDPKQGKNIANGIKKIVKSIFTKRIIIILIAVILIIAIIAAGLFDFRVQQTKNSNDPESKYYREYGPDAYMSKIYISEEGTLMPEMSIDEMWEKDERYSEYLSSKDALAYFLNAQIVTQYPYIESAEEDQLNGTIKFYRMIDDEQVQMKYVSQDDFDDMVNSGSSDLFKSFTIMNNGSIKVAYTISDKYETESNDPNWKTAASKIGFEWQER